MVSMNTETTLHPAQVQILRVLLFSTEVRFSDMNVTGLSNDHFTFHLKTLVDSGLIEKHGQHYALTPRGKEFANRFDTDAAVIERQPKLGVAIVCTKETHRGREYLTQERLKQPYYGYVGFITGKIRWGETVEETAARELMEETGMTATFHMKYIKHKMDYDENGLLLEDKFFIFFHALNPKGELRTEFEGGRNSWKTLDEIKATDKLFDGVDDSCRMVDAEHLCFIERKYSVKGY
jgi:ADP-ribose pyrophosphatase YjhB (NUDIX family)